MPGSCCATRMQIKETTPSVIPEYLMIRMWGRTKTISYHIASCHSYHNATPCKTMACHTMPYHIHRIMSCNTIQRTPRVSPLLTVGQVWNRTTPRSLSLKRCADSSSGTHHPSAASDKWCRTDLAPKAHGKSWRATKLAPPRTTRPFSETPLF